MSADGAAAQRSVLSVRAGGREIALPAGDVAEVLRDVRLTRVPLAPPALDGLAAVRGRAAPVFSLARLLGVEPDADGATSRVLVLSRSPPTALSVDAVNGLGRTSAEAAPGTLVETGSGAARVLDLETLLKAQFEGRTERVRRSDPVGAGEAHAARPREAESAFLTFALAGQTYALPLETVREALNLPEHLAVLPGADRVMLGVFSRRGALLPAVSLNALLGLAEEPAGAPRRMVVARVAGADVGLAVGELRAVVRAPRSSVGPVPRLLNRGPGEARIEAMLRAGGGDGLISILSPERLFQEDTMAEILADGRRAAEVDAAGEASGEGAETLVVFRVGAETYALPVAAVQEVVNLPERLSRPPRAPDFVAGVTSHRGVVIPVVDQRRRFGIEDADRSARRRVLVTESAGLRAGFVVDEVRQVVRVPSEALRPTPDVAADAARLFDRVVDLEGLGRLVLVVDPRQLLDRAERDLLAGLTEAAAT